MSGSSAESDGDPPIFRKAYTANIPTARSRPSSARSRMAHLGLLGPVIRAEVGDRIEVTLQEQRPLSREPASARRFYTKANEGAGYPDGTSGADIADDAIPPGQTYTYHWDVPERAGPGPADPSSTVWLYHSHVNSMRDTAAGLVGVILITRRGAARPDGSRTTSIVNSSLYSAFLTRRSATIRS